MLLKPSRCSPLRKWPVPGLLPISFRGNLHSLLRSSNLLTKTLKIANAFLLLFFLSLGWIFPPSFQEAVWIWVLQLFIPWLIRRRPFSVTFSFWYHLKTHFHFMSPSVILNMCSEQGPSSSMSWRCSGAAVSFTFAPGAITVPFLLAHKCEHWISWFHHFHTQRMTMGSSKQHLGAVFKLKSVPFSYWCSISVAPSCTRSWCSREVV